MEDTSVWRSPEALVTIGYQRSTVVMMNEAHSGLQRCIRTREIGRRILPAAHQAGVRHLAMEALWPYHFAEEANRTRCLPTTLTEGYLAQPEMRLFMQAALDLGWILIPYEPELRRILRKSRKLQSLDPERLNWRKIRRRTTSSPPFVRYRQEPSSWFGVAGVITRRYNLKTVRPHGVPILRTERDKILWD